MNDLYVPESFAGPIDERYLQYMINLFEELNPGLQLDESYLQHIQEFHGGRFHRIWFRLDGGYRRIGRMLTFASERTLLPSQRFHDDYHYDYVDWSIPRIHGIANFDSAFWGGLFPIAIPYFGDFHPDELLTRLHYSDLISLLHFRDKPAAVVLWRQEDAHQEQYRWEDEGLDACQHFEAMNCVAILAPSFSQFLDSLTVDPIDSP